MSTEKSKTAKVDQASFPPSVLETALRAGKIGEVGPIIFKVLNKTRKPEKVRSGFLTALDFDADPGTIQLHPSTMKKLGLRSNGERVPFVDEQLFISECPLPKVRQATIKPYLQDWYDVLGKTQQDLDRFMNALEHEFRQLTTISAGDTITIEQPDGTTAILLVKEIQDAAGNSITSGVVIETDIDLVLDRNNLQ